MRLEFNIFRKFVNFVICSFCSRNLLIPCQESVENQVLRHLFLYNYCTTLRYFVMVFTHIHCVFDHICNHFFEPAADICHHNTFYCEKNKSASSTNTHFTLNISSTVSTLNRSFQFINHIKCVHFPKKTIFHTMLVVLFVLPKKPNIANKSKFFQNSKHTQ